MVNKVRRLRSREVTTLTSHPVLFDCCGSRSVIRLLPHLGPRGAIRVLTAFTLILSSGSNQIRYAWGGKKTWSKPIDPFARKYTRMTYGRPVFYLFIVVGGYDLAL